MKAAPQDSRLPLRDAVKEMKSTLLEINNQKRQFEIVDRYNNVDKMLTKMDSK